MNYSLKIIFGKEAVRKYERNDNFTIDEIISNVKEFHFDTEAEKNAFVHGMDAVIGWTEYVIVE